MAWVQWTFGVLSIIAIIIFVIIRAKMLQNVKKVDVTANMPFVENYFRREFTDGYTQGRLKKITPRPNGCSLIEFYPTDIEEGEEVPVPGMKWFVVKDEFIKPISPGDKMGSSRRTIIKTLTGDLDKIKREIKDFDEGKWYEKEGMLAELKANYGKFSKNSKLALKSMIDEMTDIGITRKEVATKQEVYRQMLKDLRTKPIEETDDKK